MQTSEQINELAGALAKAQADIGAAKKDATNPHFKSQYATLASAWAAWQEVGPKNGLAVVQSVGSEEGASIVTTRLCHSSGQWMESEIRLKLQKDDMQGMGSAITYARRYSLMAMAGIAPADDDDGNAAVQSGAKAAPKAKAKAAASDAKANQEQAASAYATALAAKIEGAKTEAEMMKLWDGEAEKTGRIKDRYPELYSLLEAAYNDKLTTFNPVAAG